MQKESPDIVHILRIAGWMWLSYILALVVTDLVMYSDAPRSMLGVFYLTCGAEALLFLGLSYWSLAQKILKRYFIPLMLLTISALPIATGRIWMPPLPPGPMSNIEGMTLRLLPVLFIGMVLTAWQYSWFVIALYALGTALLEVAILLVLPPAQADATKAAVFVAIIRSVSFLIVGYFISRLMQRLRVQQRELAQVNTRLVNYASTLEQLTISQERNRMARELHDTLAHTLTGLSVQLETVKAYWDVQPETARQLLDQALSATRSGLDETRRALKALRASPLEDMGLLLALCKLAEDASERGKLRLELGLPQFMPTLPPDVEQCIYRVAQEAIENVLNHANASTLDVRLKSDDVETILEIRDDGMGLHSGQADNTDHYGLAGMRERAELLGGELIINSQIPQGTRVQLKIKGTKDESNRM